MGAWRGATVPPLDSASGATAAGNSPLSGAAPSLTPANNNELQVYFYDSQSSTGPAITLPGAITRRLNATSSKEGFSLAFGDLAAPAAGSASSTYTATATLTGGVPVLTAQAVLLIAAGQSNLPTPTATPTAVSTVDVLTYHNDNARTGQNLSEQILTTTNVKSSLFGKLFEVGVDGKVDGQPLIKTQLNIPGSGVHNVLYAVTEHDTIYAFDADNGSLIWSKSMLGANETSSDARSCGQVSPEIGITSTPVIDPSVGSDGVIYLVAMSKDKSNNYFQRIHALDLVTGAEELGGPVTVAATVPGTGAGSLNGQLPFSAKQYKERAGLLLLNGVLYTTWASHCDISPYTGWIISYTVNAQNMLVQNSVLNIIPNGSDGAIWQAGAGPATDNLGNIYFLAPMAPSIPR
jgi:outer membrane protein assembly factor BamB